MQAGAQAVEEVPAAVQVQAVAEVPAAVQVQAGEAPGECRSA